MKISLLTTHTHTHKRDPEKHAMIWDNSKVREKGKRGLVKEEGNEAQRRRGQEAGREKGDWREGGRDK